jgi:predicted lipoprotein with Yx(FWY)xxD motif
MNHAKTNRASIVALLVPILVVVVAACSAAGSPPSTAGSAFAASATPSVTASPATATPTTSPTAPPATAAPTASPATAAPTASPARPAPSDTVKIGVATSMSLGSYLTGPNGRTLYTLSSDPKDKSTCAGQCATAWPPLKIASNGKVEASVMGTFEIIKRADGTDQVALDGHPLYEFIKDTARGQTNGEGIVAFGGTWHVAKAG